MGERRGANAPERQRTVNETRKVRSTGDGSRLDAALGTGSGPASRPLWRRMLGSRGLQALVGLLVFGLLLARWLDWIGGVEPLRERFGVHVAALVIPVHAVVSFVPLSGEMIAVANGLLFGFWLGSLFTWTAWMLTSLLQYAVVRRTARDFDFDTRHARLPAWLRSFPVDHPVFLIGVRVPFGGPIVNSAAGAFGVPLWRHTWCAAIGVAPRALFFAGIASGLLQL
jgi:hypothetical protein